MYHGFSDNAPALLFLSLWSVSLLLYSLGTFAGTWFLMADKQLGLLCLSLQEKFPAIHVFTMGEIWVLLPDGGTYLLCIILPTLVHDV